MRIELNDENTEKVLDFEKQLRENFNIQISPNQIVNIFVGAIERADLKQIVEITIKTPPSVQPPRRKSIKSQTNWVMRTRF